MHARRARLGLVSATSEEDIEGPLGFTLGVAYGLQYNEKKPGKCYTSIKDTILDLNTITSLLLQIYNPMKWAEFAMGTQDYVKMGAAVYANCNVQQFFNTMSSLITGEGASTLGARLFGGMIFEIPNYYEDFMNAESDYASGKAIGKIV